MEATSKTEPAAGEKKKVSLGQKFMNFLMYGGFIVVLVDAVAIVILVEKLMK